MSNRSQTAPVQSEERSDDKDGQVEFPHELKRRAAVWKNTIGNAVAALVRQTSIMTREKVSKKTLRR